MPVKQSSALFKKTFLWWIIFGLWRGGIPAKYYKYYSVLYLFSTFFCYNILLTLNLIYTPRTIELMLQEVIFYFTEITVAAKVLTIILMRKKIIKALEIMDCDEFVGDYERKDGVIVKMHVKYNFFLNMYIISSNISFICNVFVPIFVYIIEGTEAELPICKYYFLSDENRRSNFIFWFTYQSVGMFGHMMYNVTIDAFISGLIFVAISQLRLLNSKLTNLKLSEEEKKLTKELQDKISIASLNDHLRHYDTILRYYHAIQNIMSVALFFQFGASSIIICVVMCGLILPSTTASKVFLVIYLLAMTGQIFVPAFLGTLLTHESQELIFAAYNCDWIPRSEAFKRSLRIFMERAQTPFLITGLEIFPLTLATFTSIMKTAYSFFTLIRNFQEQ